MSVVIPVKSGKRKSRLSALLGRGQREEISDLLLTEVLGAARSAGLIRSCHVVSSDPRVLVLAARLGAQTITEPADAGVNSAVTLAMGKVGPGTDLLVVPSDLPLIEGSELTHLLEATSQGVDVAIAPSMEFDGTNALYFQQGSPIRLSYDDDSFWNHLSSAASEKLTVRVLTEPGLMFDVDSPEDLRRLSRTRSRRAPAKFARRVLG